MTDALQGDALAVDLYPGDDHYDLQKLADAGLPWALVALKFTQGTRYVNDAWTRRMWPLARNAFRDRYGKTGFRVPYHYLVAGVDGIAQGEFFKSHVLVAGDLGYGDPFIMLDVERSDQGTVISKQQIIDSAGGFVKTVHETYGLRIVVYGGEYLRSNEIKISDFGCSYAWVADYEAQLRPTHYTKLGIDVAHLLAWQYGGLEGDGHEEVHLKGYPWTSPAGKADLSAITLDGGGQHAIDVLASWCVQAV